MEYFVLKCFFEEFRFSFRKLPRPDMSVRKKSHCIFKKYFCFFISFKFFLNFFIRKFFPDAMTSVRTDSRTPFYTWIFFRTDGHVRTPKKMLSVFSYIFTVIENQIFYSFIFVFRNISIFISRQIGLIY